MADTQELKALLDRVEKAEEADRELDKDIWLNTVGFDPELLPTVWPDIGEPEMPFPLLTQSIDAALALTERVLPGWQVIGIEQSWTGPYPISAQRDNLQSRAWLRKSVGSYIIVEASAPTPALALIAALLKAKIAEAESGG